MSPATETCPCGAAFTDPSITLVHIQRWRDSHAVCRDPVRDANEIDALREQRDEARELLERVYDQAVLNRGYVSSALLDEIRAKGHTS